MLAEYTRQEFVENVWNWRPGEHVLIISRTGGGKSYLAWQLLEQSMKDYPDQSPVVMMPKWADPTTELHSQRLGLKEIPTWPPKHNFWDEKPNGYVLWPHHPKNVDPNTRRAVVGAEIAKGMDAQLWGMNSITFMDDAHSAAAMYGLGVPIEEHLVNGRAGKSSIWLATQKPSGTNSGNGISSFAYSSATHTFFGKDKDERNITRFGEIGGLDRKFVEQTVRDLRLYDTESGDSITQWLYIDGRGPYACLVNP